MVHSFPLFCPFTGIVQLNLSAENFNKFSFYLSELVQHQQQASLADKQLSRMLSVLIIKYLDLFIDGENSISQLTDPLLKRFVDSVGRGFRNNHNVEYYADQIGTTTKTLNRRLKETLGITPKDIINYRINSEAMRIFASNDTSVKEIAYQLGFNSPDYFHNFFKRLNKITPSNYKKQLTYAISDL
ncbi:helix-turn-helix domain-containing protein [Candidatus Endoriftia persephonae]|uniref:Helix-turn-helix domain-containing protein n=1 Tax=Candidatus Endoriftia persephonae TaxID=393765 RepID=A0A9J6ZU25_9GAMM|nr:helix-turn-helix domain-containing protein [Candidatus Endoriftia persephone]USF86221.1 helix-turn-helix domain-containing protein [Candidatus Endoriftia persephone]